MKRAIDSMDDCFDFIEEPLYGFRVNVTQEIQCSELGQGLLYRWTEHLADVLFLNDHWGGENATPNYAPRLNFLDHDFL